MQRSSFVESLLNCLYIQDTVVVELHKGVIEYKIYYRGKMTTPVSIQETSTQILWNYDNITFQENVIIKSNILVGRLTAVHCVSFIIVSLLKLQTCVIVSHTALTDSSTLLRLLSCILNNLQTQSRCKQLQLVSYLQCCFVVMPTDGKTKAFQKCIYFIPFH